MFNNLLLFETVFIVALVQYGLNACIEDCIDAKVFSCKLSMNKIAEMQTLKDIAATSKNVSYIFVLISVLASIVTYCISL